MHGVGKSFDVSTEVAKPCCDVWLGAEAPEQAATCLCPLSGAHPEGLGEAGAALRVSVGWVLEHGGHGLDRPDFASAMPGCFTELVSCYMAPCLWSRTLRTAPFSANSDNHMFLNDTVLSMGKLVLLEQFLQRL